MRTRDTRRLGPAAVARSPLLLAVFLATPLYAQDRRVVREVMRPLWFRYIRLQQMWVR